jgi:hypothetical protein
MTFIRLPPSAGVGDVRIRVVGGGGFGKDGEPKREERREKCVWPA